MLYCRGFMISILFILAIWHSRIAVNPGKAVEKKKKSVFSVNITQQCSH